MSGIKRLKAKEKRILQSRALDKCVKPFTPEQLDALRPMTLPTFKDNIAKLWPIVLSMVSEGTSIKDLEAFLGLNRYVLRDFLANHPRLQKSVRTARQLRLDKQTELNYILS